MMCLLIKFCRVSTINDSSNEEPKLFSKQVDFLMRFKIDPMEKNSLFGLLCLFHFTFTVSLSSPPSPRWVGHYPPEDLARFGYTPERKVEKLRNHAIFW
jgi:hypothetical protein